MVLAASLEGSDRSTHGATADRNGDFRTRRGRDDGTTDRCTAYHASGGNADAAASARERA